MRAYIFAALTSLVTAVPVFADGHAEPMVVAKDQAVSNGVVSASKVVATENGWLVVHRTDAEKKPGVVIGYAPIRAGNTQDVAVLLTELVEPGDLMMLMVHGEESGQVPGFYEYTLGAKEDGPVKPAGELIMTIIASK
jgi:hypothetical protein